METQNSAARTENLTASKHVAYFDLLRVISIVAVIVLHASATGWNREDLYSTDWQILNFFDGLAHFCVPVFFMISGALFLDPSRNVTVARIFYKSLPRLVIPFLFWSIIYATFLAVIGISNGSKRQFLERVFLGHFHLWFLIALAGLYLATPILRKLVTDRSTAWYFVALAVVFASLMPLLEALPLVGSLIEKNLDVAQVQIVLGYSIYFVLGYLIHTTAIPRRIIIWILAGGILGVVITTFGTSALSWAVERKWGLFYGYVTPNIVMTSVAIFVGAKYFFGGPVPSKVGANATRKLPKIIVAISKASFGIYLVHHLFQMTYRHFGFTDEVMNPLISVPLLTLAILVPSFFVTILIKKIPKVGSFLV